MICPECGYEMNGPTHDFWGHSCANCGYARPLYEHLPEYAPGCGMNQTHDTKHTNDMTPTKVYLCGPINGCTDDECKNWREKVKSILKHTVDPMRRDYRGREGDCCKEIVEGDKMDIMECDALIVNYDKPSVGTSMEILFAWEQHKKIVVVATKGTPISPWLQYHATHIVTTFEAACKRI